MKKQLLSGVVVLSLSLGGCAVIDRLYPSPQPAGSPPPTSQPIVTKDPIVRAGEVLQGIANDPVANAAAEAFPYGKIALGAAGFVGGLLIVLRKKSKK